MLIDVRKNVLELTPDYSSWVDRVSRKVFSSDTGSLGACLNIQQVQMLESLRKNKFNIIKSPRQIGVTTMVFMNTAYNVLYGQDNVDVSVTEDKNCKGDKEVEYSELYIYSTFNSARDSMKRFEKILDMCEEKIYLLENDTFSMKLRFGDRVSVIRFIPEDFVKKGVPMCDRITVDNAAFVSEDTMNRIPGLSRDFNCNVTIASTPRKESGFFYELWKETLYGRGCFKPTALKWYLDNRFNKNLNGTEGLASYDASDIGMMFEALERGDYLSNEWYKERKEALGSSWVNELDGNFADRWNS